MVRQASPMAWVEVAQAEQVAKLGPRSLKYIENNPEAILAMEYMPQAMLALGFQPEALLQWIAERGYRVYTLAKSGMLQEGNADRNALHEYGDLLLSHRTLVQ
jgi:hypothetical protein